MPQKVTEHLKLKIAQLILRGRKGRLNTLMQKLNAGRTEKIKLLPENERKKWALDIIAKFEQDKNDIIVLQ